MYEIFNIFFLIKNKSLYLKIKYLNIYQLNMYTVFQ